jgi:hypothetical protein
VTGYGLGSRATGVRVPTGADSLLLSVDTGSEAGPSASSAMGIGIKGAETCS